MASLSFCESLILLSLPQTAPDPCSHRLLREVESSFLQIFSRYNFILYFERFPCWLIALDLNFVNHISLPQFNSWSAFQRFVQHTLHRNPILIEVLLDLTPNRKIFGAQPIPASDLHTLILISLS